MNRDGCAKRQHGLIANYYLAACRSLPREAAQFVGRPRIAAVDIVQDASKVRYAVRAYRIRVTMSRFLPARQPASWHALAVRATFCTKNSFVQRERTGIRSCVGRTALVASVVKMQYVSGDSALGR